MDLQALSREYGFAACYVFTTEPFVYYERRLQDGALHSAGTDLSPDLKKTAPWANAIVALLYPYRPYADEIPVSGNYPSSNAAFHAIRFRMSSPWRSMSAARAAAKARTRPSTVAFTICFSSVTATSMITKAAVTKAKC